MLTKFYILIGSIFLKSVANGNLEIVDSFVGMVIVKD